MFSRDQVLTLMRERVHHPAATRELLQILKVPRDERTTFKRHIKSLVASGELIQIRGHRFGLPEKMDLYVGKLQAHPAGYGFVTPERPLEMGGDIYISGPMLNEAMHGDRVVVRIERIKEGGRAEGRIIRIVERANETIVGRYVRGDDGMAYVSPFERRVLMDILVPAGQEGGASSGDMVIVELTRWPTSTRGAIGRVSEVLGDIDKPGVDTEIIIRKWGIPDAHSNDAIAEALRLGLDGQKDAAKSTLQAAIDDINATRLRKGRTAYLVYAGAMVLGALAMLCGVAGTIWFGWQATPDQVAKGLKHLMMATGSGAMGALLSTAIALRARTVATDLDLKSNAVDSAVRIMIGVISAAVLYLVLDSNLLDEVKVQGVTLKPDINWKVALLVGFAAGFMERLVPDLLEKKLAPAMAK